MNYRFLGSSGLQVSELSLGPWLTISKHLSVKKASALIHCAIEQGINFFDNAERYAEGMAESVLGQIFRGYHREDLVITTKIYWGGEGVNRVGLSRKHLVEGTKNSLRRLQLEYVDVLFCHRPDENTPMEEVVVTMDMLIRQGYAFYWGTSEWPASAIHEAHSVAKQLGCIRPIVEQTEYNIFVRDRVEQEYSPLYNNFAMGVTVSGPLASGLLTGKYTTGFADNFRLTHEKRLWTNDFTARQTIAENFAALAKTADVTPAQLALAWCLRKPYVSSVIMGTSSLEQLHENLGAIAVTKSLNPNIYDKINSLVENKIAEKAF